MEKTAEARALGKLTLCRLMALTILSIGAMSSTASSAATPVGNRITAIIVDKAGKPLEHAVLSVHTGTPTMAAPSTVVSIDQREMEFVPRVAAMQAGSNVSFPNQDDVQHHVYSFSHPNAFELELYHGEAGQFQRFEHPGVVVLGCNIHDHMVGYVRVVDTPYFATSNAQGVLTIENIPAGRHTLQIWHPDQGMLPIEKPVELADGSLNVRLKLDVKTPAAAKPKHQSNYRYDR